MRRQAGELKNILNCADSVYAIPNFIICSTVIWFHLLQSWQSANTNGIPPYLHRFSKRIHFIMESMRRKPFPISECIRTVYIWHSQLTIQAFRKKSMSLPTLHSDTQQGLLKHCESEIHKGSGWMKTVFTKSEYHYNWQKSTESRYWKCSCDSVLFI